MTVPLAYVVYRITFPNGKIYVGKDVGGIGHSLRYFGSWDDALVAIDLTDEQLRNLTLRKEILFESRSKAEVSLMESKLIVELRANDPTIGYNRTHRAHSRQTAYKEKRVMERVHLTDVVRITPGLRDNTPGAVPPPACYCVGDVVHVERGNGDTVIVELQADERNGYFEGRIKVGSDGDFEIGTEVSFEYR